MNIVSTGQSTSLECGLNALFKGELRLNVTAECLNDGQETQLLVIILGEGFQVIHIEKMIHLAVLGHISISAIVDQRAKGSEGNAEKQW